MTNNAQSVPLMLLLNASPRPAGRVARWLAAIESAARADGFCTETLRVADLSVQPCRGCMACRQSGRCVLPADDAQRTLAILKEADALVVGTPCYWGNVPGQLKVLLDRMVYGMMGESRRAVPVPLMQGKRAAVVATCSTPWPFNRWFSAVEWCRARPARGISLERYPPGGHRRARRASTGATAQFPRGSSLPARGP